MRNAVTFTKLPSDSGTIPKITVGHCGWPRPSVSWNSFMICPRTDANLAAVLVDEVGQATPLSEVQAAVKRLNTAQFIRNTEEGWKLQTAQEKNWETERRGHLEPKPRDRNELARTALQQIFDEPE